MRCPGVKSHATPFDGRLVIAPFFPSLIPPGRQGENPQILGLEDNFYNFSLLQGQEAHFG